MPVSTQALVLMRALSPRSAALAGTLVAAAIWIGGVASGSGWTLSFDADLGIPIIFSGGLAALAGWLLWVAGNGAELPPREAVAWKVLGVSLVLIGIEQAGSLHERIDEGLALSPALGAAPLLILTAIAVALALRAPALPERNVLLGGLALWGASGLLDAFDHGAGSLAALCYLAAAPLLAAGALAAAQRCRAGEGGTPPRPAVAARDLLLRLDIGDAAVAILAYLAVMLGLCVLYHAGVLPTQTFDLRSQQGANTFTSITLMIVAGGLALIRGRVSDDPWYAWTLLGLTFWVMSVDDTIAGHQLIGDATGVRGQFVLFPIVIAAAVGWFSCVARSTPAGRRLFVGGAVAWVVSQAIDVSKPEGYFHWWVLPEETLELLGTTAFLLAMLLAVQATARGRRSAGEEPRSEDEAQSALSGA